MIVAMNRTPPRRHTINQFSTIFQLQTHSLGADHWPNGGWLSHRTVGMPNMLAIKSEV
jgi:hypothetical protein